MKALQSLQSNAEVIAKARQNKSPVHNIPNMIKYIIRSGLTVGLILSSHKQNEHVLRFRS